MLYESVSKIAEPGNDCMNCAFEYTEQSTYLPFVYIVLASCEVIAQPLYAYICIMSLKIKLWYFIGIVAALLIKHGL